MKEKICKFCGKSFIPNSNRQSYCKRIHYRNCPVCGKQYIEDNVDNLKKPPVACSYECRKKRREETSMKKYGIKAPGNNPEARKKASETMMKNLGVPYAMMSQEVRQKSKETNIQKYGHENAGSNPDIIQKRMDTCHRKYGDKLPFNLPETYDKVHKTIMERYGQPNYFLTKEFTEQTKHNGKISSVNRKYGDLLSKNKIKYELERTVGDYIYDIYIPDSNTLVEINPTYTHNIVGNHWMPDGINRFYHVDKTNNGRKAGYNVVNIWDWDDWEKILDIVAIPQVKVYARDCRVFKLNKRVGKQFIDKYDIAGNCNGQILFLGLVQEEELLQVMSLRRTSSNSIHEIELCRLCTKPTYQVVGGASRLFHFVTHVYELHDIIAYNDLSKFDGSVFETIGMKYSHTNPAQIIWSKDKKYISDNMLYLYDKSRDDMLNGGYLPVVTCGTSAYVYE